MKQWKLLVPLILAGGLMACSPAGTDVAQNEPKQQVEQQSTIPIADALKTPDDKLILGAREWVYLPDLDENFKSRIDTGATTSSISALDVESYERDGKDWVTFRIEHDGIKSEKLSLPVKRWVHIRQSSAEGTQRRAVVMVRIQIGDTEKMTEFTLADRTHLRYPLLLGRSFLKSVSVVDVSRNYVQGKHE